MRHKDITHIKNKHKRKVENLFKRVEGHKIGGECLTCPDCNPITCINGGVNYDRETTETDLSINTGKDI